jgi:hypothetical protein
MVGGDYLPPTRAGDDGRLVQIARKGPKIELNFAHLMMRRLTITDQPCARSLI